MKPEPDLADDPRDDDDGVEAGRREGVEPPEGKSEGWRADTKKILLAQVLTLILTPATVGVTLYFTEEFKAPKPRVEYTRVEPYVFLEEPSAALRERILAEPRLVESLRVELMKRNAPPECVAWLDGEDWQGQCRGLYASSAEQSGAQLADVIGRLKDSDFRGSPLNMMFPSREDGLRAGKILTELKNELASLGSREPERSGDVEIRVGLLNAGASDGTVFNSARITFAGGSFSAYAKEYVAIKSHSFSEVSFVTAREYDGEVYGRWSDGDEKAIKAWSDLVKKGEEFPFTVTVTVSDNKATAKSSVDAR